MIITNMMVDYRKEPVGTDEMHPLFGWNVDEAGNSYRQKAYRITVALSEEELTQELNLLWDSGVTESDRMVNIRYEGEPFVSGTRYFWKAYVWQEGGIQTTASGLSFFETGLLRPSDWHGVWIGETKNHEYHVYRNTFTIGRDVKSARLYICGLGHNECYINGKKTGNRVLEPGWTNYQKSCLYSVYDVTDQLRKGVNAIGIILGDGMYNVPGGRYVYFERSFGKAKFLLQLNIILGNGEKMEFVSDEGFRRKPGPVIFSCIYGGEDYDGRLEDKGFDRPDYVEGNDWYPVVCAEPPGGELVSQSIPPLSVRKIYQPISVKETEKEVYLYDLGKNFSGWARIRLKSGTGKAGHVVTMTPGEILTPQQVPDQRVTGRGYHWQYTMNGEYRQEYAPKFTYTGFRYVQVTGAVPEELAGGGECLPIIESLTGEFIYPEMEKKGGFHCSNRLFNQIHDIILQSIKSNIKSIFTDCPHREKLGWLEETHLIGPAMHYNFDLRSLYKKVERDMRESQRENGLIPDISPEYIVFGYHEGFVDSPEWGSAVIINPWYLYLWYGDITLLEENYDIMKRYLEYLEGKTCHKVLHHGLGDWLDIGPCTPYSQNTPVPVVATAVFYQDIIIMEQTATLLGRTEDAKRLTQLKKEVFDEYNLQFYDAPTGRYATGSQTAQAMSLMTGLVPEEEQARVFQYLVKDIKAREFATTAGDIGHPYVLAALTKFGGSDIVNQMMNMTDKPGYGYQVVNGATTLAEEWDGPEPGRPHGSQNHLMLGSVDEWFYAGLAGIQTVRNDSPFDRIIIRPHFAKGCESVSAWVKHPYGRILVDWHQDEKQVKVKLKVPANATAIFQSETDGSERVFGSGDYEFVLEKYPEQAII